MFPQADWSFFYTLPRLKKDNGKRHIFIFRDAVYIMFFHKSSFWYAWGFEGQKFWRCSWIILYQLNYRDVTGSKWLNLRLNCKIPQLLFENPIGRVPAKYTTHDYICFNQIIARFWHINDRKTFSYNSDAGSFMTLFCDIMNSTLPCYYTTEGIYTDILTTKTQFKPLQANYRFSFRFVSFCFVSFCFANYS